MYILKDLLQIFKTFKFHTRLCSKVSGFQYLNTEGSMYLSDINRAEYAAHSNKYQKLWAEDIRASNA